MEYGEGERLQVAVYNIEASHIVQWKRGPRRALSLTPVLIGLRSFAQPWSTWPLNVSTQLLA